MARTLVIEVYLEPVLDDVDADSVIAALEDAASQFTDGFAQAEVVDERDIETFS